MGLIYLKKEKITLEDLRLLTNPNLNTDQM